MLAFIQRATQFIQGCDMKRDSAYTKDVSTEPFIPLQLFLAALTLSVRCTYSSSLNSAGTTVVEVKVGRGSREETGE